MVKDGDWEITVNRGSEALSVVLSEWGMVSIPPNTFRSMRNVGETDALMLVVTSGDGRVRLEWDDEVVKAAADAGDAIDHNGYLAPYALVPR